MNRTLSYTIEEQHAGMDIKSFLRSMNYSSQIISNQKHVEDGIMHNGHRAYVTETLAVKDNVTINIHETNSSEKIPPIKMELEILYEDEDLIVINKPADMPVHPSLNNYENTLANGLAHYYESQGENFVFRCMNRLDRNTTGAVLIAKNALSAAILSQMIRERKIEKEYVAITEGIVDLGALDSKRCENANPQEGTFTINAPIGRVDGSSIERCIDFDKGERAVTHVKILGVIEGVNLCKSFTECTNIYNIFETNDVPCTVVSCNLETGRTHQIRVHMASIGHPLVGDGLYNPRYQNDKFDPKKHRQLLHCRKLRFRHPITGEEVNVAAHLPKDMSMMTE